MKTYTAIKKSPVHNTVIPEINAAVLTATFPGKGTHKADVYSSRHEVSKVVFHGTCPPVHQKFVETINVII